MLAPWRSISRPITFFFPFAEFEPVTPKGEEEPPMKPNTFGVLLVGEVTMPPRQIWRAVMKNQAECQ